MNCFRRALLQLHWKPNVAPHPVDISWEVSFLLLHDNKRNVTLLHLRNQCGDLDCEFHVAAEELLLPCVPQLSSFILTLTHSTKPAPMIAILSWWKEGLPSDIRGCSRTAELCIMECAPCLTQKLEDINNWLCLMEITFRCVHRRTLVEVFLAQAQCLNPTSSSSPPLSSLLQF